MMKRFISRLQTMKIINVMANNHSKYNIIFQNFVFFISKNKKWNEINVKNIQTIDHNKSWNQKR